MMENEVKMIEKDIINKLADFMVVWFIIIISFYLLASLHIFTFLTTMGPLGGFFVSLTLLYYIEGLFIGCLIIYLKNYKDIFFTLKKKDRVVLISSWIGLFVFILVIFLIIIGYLTNNLSTYQSLPTSARVDIATAGVAYLIPDFVYFTVIFVLILGIMILVKNHRSETTRVFFLSFISIGIAFIMYILYILTPPLYNYDFTTDPVTVTIMQNPRATQLFYLFFILIQAGFYILIHAIRSISSLKQIWLPKKFYGLFFVLGVLSTILLFSSEVKHVLTSSVPLISPFIRVREYSLSFSLIYLLIQVIPIVISLYYLSRLPPWITPERKTWLSRFKFGVIVYSFFPICETIAGIRIPFTTGFVSAYNPLERYKLLLSVSFLIVVLSMLIIFSGVPKLDKWFFDEIKFRASPELRKLNPNVNLAAIWEQVDDWQKVSKLTPKEMTTQKLEEYVQAAKNLLLQEEGKPAIV